MNISRSFELCVNVLLIVDMHDLNGALFLNATSFSTLSSSFAATMNLYNNVPFTTMNASYNHANLILA